MSLGKFLEGVALALGQGAMQNYNVQTLGPDFKEKREESTRRNSFMEAQTDTQRIAQILEQLKIQDAPKAAARAQAESEASVAESKARAFELTERPKKYDEEAARIRAQIDNYLNQNVNRDKRTDIMAGRADDYGRNVDSQIGNRGTTKGPKALTVNEFRALRKTAEDRANETTSADFASEQEIQAEYEKLVAAYVAQRGATQAPVAGAPAPAASPAPAGQPQTKVFTTGPCAGKTARRRPDGKWEC